jgi:methionine synthase II (cobalamin-independent)
MTDSGSYQTGYKNPPKQNRFKKGQSGNPKGRPKGSKNVATVLQKANRQVIKVTKGGRIKRMSLVEAIIQQLINKAASGDLKAIHEYLYCQRIFVVTEQISESGPAFDEKDRPVLAGIFKRLAKHKDLLADIELDEGGSK